ncbi:MAG: hypothetical protein IT518_09720 [Burkholderiales bacterium]|nr:hypothetical protein [Burkholderiales bacterium]
MDDGVACPVVSAPEFDPRSMIARRFPNSEDGPRGRSEPLDNPGGCPLFFPSMSHEQFTLRGAEPGQAIEFVATPQISNCSFDISACFGGYRVAATSVTLFVGSFVQDLASFESRRAGTAKLTGTYDFELEVGAFESRGDALVNFGISHLLLLPTRKYGRCRLDGAFVVSGEHVAEMLHGMERLFASDATARAK